jgi:hypothetical protein
VQQNDSAIQKLGVNPASWNWYNKDYSKYAEKKKQPVPRKLNTEGAKFAPVPFVIAVVLFLGYASAFLYSWFVDGTFPVVSAIIGAVLLVGIVCCVFALLIPGIIILGIALILAILNFVTGHVIEGFMFLGAIAAGFASVYLLIYSLPTSPETEQKNAVTDTKDQVKRVYGKPGGVGNAVDKFGAAAVSAGVAGEKSTALLLDLLLKIPGVTIYHGLKFPGSETADVDHAVVHGRRVFLIDSKQYRSGEYRWLTKHDGWSPVASNGWGTQAEVIKGGGHEFDNSMSSAHESFKELLGSKVMVSSLVVVHGKDIKIPDPGDDSPSGVKLCTADYAMRLIGAACELNLKSWKDDKKVMETMRRQLK